MTMGEFWAAWESYVIANGKEDGNQPMTREELEELMRLYPDN